MSLQTEIEEEKNTNKSPEKDDDAASSSSEAISPSPKRQNQKQTPTTVATRKSTRNQQTTLTNSLGNHIPINAIESASTTGRRQFEIDSTPDRSTQGYTSLNSLIQEMGFSEKKPRVQGVCTIHRGNYSKKQTITNQNKRRD